MSDPMAEGKVVRTAEEWKAELGAKAYQVLREAGTEPAGSGEYNKHYPKKGYYACRACKLPLYSFAAKFDSGCGWPAYNKCFHSKAWGGHVEFRIDNSHGMERTEIRCKRCEGHLGHVFYGEMAKDSERHCVNSVAVVYVDESEPAGVVSGPVKADMTSKI